MRQELLYYFELLEASSRAPTREQEVLLHVRRVRQTLSPRRCKVEA